MLEDEILNPEQASEFLGMRPLKPGKRRMRNVGPEAVRAALRSGEMRGRSIGRGWWLTTKLAVLDWLNSGNQGKSIPKSAAEVLTKPAE